jgi:uncharacterized cupin superfamily protein
MAVGGRHGVARRQDETARATEWNARITISDGRTPLSTNRGEAPLATARQLGNIRLTMHRTQIPSLRWEERRSPSGKFHSFARNVSLALGGQRDVGTWGGGHPFDVQVRRIPPGAIVCPFHLHFAQWELFIVLSGAGTVRTPEGTTPAGAGDALLHSPGEAHQLTNTGDADLLYYCVADNPPVDYWRYPDSDKWGFREPRKIFRTTDADYFDDEE